ncbi:MAG: YggT family protein [Actinomycetales bacterium]|nr:MAG: YggT family protein [Actinomycetales bacterium]
MRLAWQVVSLLLFLFLVLLIARLVLVYVRMFARSWRPQGVVLVAAEVVYTVTDPPLRMVRRIIPPLTIGGLRIDLAFIVLFLITSTLMGIQPF